MLRIPRAATALTLTLAAAACEDGATVPSADLTETEAAALADVVLAITLDAGLSVDPTAASAAAAPGLAPTTVDLSFDFEAACPLGGTLGVALDLDGTLDPQTKEGEVTLALVEVPRGCVVRHEESERLFTLDGAPDVRANLTVVGDGQGTMSLSGTYAGAVHWATDGRDGTCAIDLAFSGSGSGATGAASGTLSGSACGVSVDHAWSR